MKATAVMMIHTDGSTLASVVLPPPGHICIGRPRSGLGWVPLVVGKVEAINPGMERGAVKTSG